MVSFILRHSLDIIVQVQSDIAAYRQKGLVLFAVLKKLNRLSHLYCKDTREQTHEQKLEVDDIHLQLQNLMYESMHLKREINNCLEFKYAPFHPLPPPPPPPPPSLSPPISLSLCPSYPKESV